MLILLIFAFISGLITIAAPCIWPLLPIILSASTSGGHKKPLGITLGIMTSFALFTLTISYIVKIIPFDPDILRLVAVVVISFLGLTLVIPKLTLLLEGFVSRLSSRFAIISQTTSTGFSSGYITGFSLGLVWSPCAGPILATIATLAATQSVNFRIILITLAYVIGIGVPLFIFATIGTTLLTRSSFLSNYTARIQQIFGVIMILTAIAIYTNYDKVLQAKLLDIFPAYSNFIYNLEGRESVKKQLDTLKETKKQMLNLNKAPEFVGINKWLNSEPLTLAQLKGKVVLVDFWTYTCINCIRTLPHVVSWYEKYKDKGFVVIGVHTPEFEFEKNEENVLTAMKQYKITYPVAQDNDYATWKAYDNHYWPAEYLIDAQGNIRRTHFGEGDYDETEKAIQDLLKEAGQTSDMSLTEMPDQTPKSRLTPETYVGEARREGNNLTLGGSWDIQPEYAASKNDSSLDLKFIANKVFLVITPATTSDIINVTLDGKLINTITAHEAKLYQLVDLQGNSPSTHLLHLDFQTHGTKIYAFTFGD